MEPVKDHQGMKIIGIDNGYGNIKTANCCFPAGLVLDRPPPSGKDVNDLLLQRRLGQVKRKEEWSR